MPESVRGTILARKPLESGESRFKRIAIKFIASQRGQKTVMSKGYDLTDYPALEAFVLGFIGDQVQKRTHSTP